MPLDYSKWKDIEVSDDEDDIHPNVDTGSLFRWRHQARVERMEERDKKKHEMDEREKSLKKIREEIEAKKTKEGVESIKSELEKLDLEEKKFEEEKSALDKEERLAPWNVDTISQPKFSKTIINKPKPKVDDSNLSEDEKAKRYEEFINKNESDIKKYAMFRKFSDSKRFLTENLHLVCEDTANYLVIYCLNLEMQQKHNLMKHVAHQTIVMQFILELAKQLDVDPRQCCGQFFDKIQMADQSYKDLFNNELSGFIERISKRGAEKLDKYMKEAEEEARKEREEKKKTDPSYLDPEEVLNSLPEGLRACFENQDMSNLNGELAKLDERWAVYHMNRCVKSGLWVPADPKIFENIPADVPPPSDDNERHYEEVIPKTEEKAE